GAFRLVAAADAPRPIPVLAASPVPDRDGLSRPLTSAARRFASWHGACLGRGSESRRAGRAPTFVRGPRPESGGRRGPGAVAPPLMPHFFAKQIPFRHAKKR